MESNKASDKVRCVLKDIYPKEITLEKASASRLIILKDLLKKFKDTCLNLDPAYRCIFNKYYFTGSSFEGLRVKEATEFDVNVVLKFPFSDDDVFWFEEADSAPSFATFQLKQPFERMLEKYSYGDSMKCLACFFDNDNYLIGKKVLSWFQSLVDQYIDSANFDKPAEVQKIEKRNSGPARTLKVRLEKVWISVDLVPVFTLNCRELLKKIVYQDDIVKPDLMCRCSLVPKPLKEIETYDLTTEQSSRLWRIHFPEAEKQILENKNNLKPVIKLVKGLRDKENWPIPSYFIKTVAFWIVKRHPEKDYYEGWKLGILFLEVLKTLRQHLLDERLGHIFYPDCNLLLRINSKALPPICDRLTKIIAELQKSPNAAHGLFKCPRHPKKVAKTKAKYTKQYCSV